MKKYKFEPTTPYFTPNPGEFYFTIKDFLVQKKRHSEAEEATLASAMKRNNVFSTFDDAYEVRMELLNVLEQFQNEKLDFWQGSSEDC